MLDIDAGSQYHNELGLARIKHALCSVGLTAPAFYQSSHSGGWHVYHFFSEWVETEALQERLKNWLRAEGFELRLPLQSGFAWLDEHGEIQLRREDLSANQALAKFLDALDANAHDWNAVETLIASRLQQLTEIAAAKAKKLEFANPETEEDGFSAFFTRAGMIQEVYNAGRD